MATPSHGTSLNNQAPNQTSLLLQNRVSSSVRYIRPPSDSDLIKSYHESILNEKFSGYMDLFPRYGTPPPLFAHQFIKIDTYTNELKIPESIVIAAIQVAALMQYCSALRSIKKHPAIAQIALDINERRDLSVIPVDEQTRGYASIIPIIVHEGITYPLKINFSPISSLKSLMAHFEQYPQDVGPLINFLHSFIPDVSLDDLWFPQKEDTVFSKNRTLLISGLNGLTDIAKDLMQKNQVQLCRMGFSLFTLALCCQDNPLSLKPDEWKILFKQLPRLAASCKTLKEKTSLSKIIQSCIKNITPQAESVFLLNIQKALKDNDETQEITESKNEEILFRTLLEIHVPQYGSLLLNLATNHTARTHDVKPDSGLEQKSFDALLESDPRNALAFFSHLRKGCAMSLNDQLVCLARLASAYKSSPFSISYFSDIHRISRHMRDLLIVGSPISADNLGELILWIAENTLIEDDSTTLNEALVLLDNGLKCNLMIDQDSSRNFQLVLIQQMVKSPQFGPAKAANRLKDLSKNFQSLPPQLNAKLNDTCVTVIEALFEEDNFEAEELAENLLCDFSARVKNLPQLLQPLIKKQLQATVNCIEMDSTFQHLTLQPLSQAIASWTFGKILRFIEVAETKSEKDYCRKLVVGHLDELVVRESLSEKFKQLNAFVKVMERSEIVDLFRSEDNCRCEIWLKIAQAAKDFAPKQGLPLYYIAMTSALQAYRHLNKPSAVITKKMALAFDVINALETRAHPTLPVTLKNILLETFPLLIEEMQHIGLTEEILSVHEALFVYPEMHVLICAKPYSLKKALVSEMLAASDVDSLNRMHNFLLKLHKAINFNKLPIDLFQAYLNFAFILGDMKWFEKSFGWFEALECTPQFTVNKVAIETYLLSLIQHIEDRTLVLKILHFCTKKKLVSQDKFKDTCVQLSIDMINKAEYDAALELLIKYKGALTQLDNVSMECHIKDIAATLIANEHPMHAAKLLNAYSLPDTLLFHKVLEKASTSQDTRTRTRSLTEFLLASKSMVEVCDRKREQAACWQLAIAIMVKDKESALIELLEHSSPLQKLLADPALSDISPDIDLKLLEGIIAYIQSKKRKEPSLESYYKQFFALRMKIYPYLSIAQSLEMRTKIDTPLLKLWEKSPNVESLCDVSQILIQHMEANAASVSSYIVKALNLSTTLTEITNPFYLILLRMVELSQQRKTPSVVMIQCIDSLLHCQHPDTLQRGAKLFLENLLTINPSETTLLPTNIQIHIGRIFTHLVKNNNAEVSLLVDEISLAISNCKFIDVKYVSSSQTAHYQRKLRNLNRREARPSSVVCIQAVNDVLKYFPLTNLKRVNYSILCDVIKCLIPLINDEGFNVELYAIDYILSEHMPELLIARENLLIEHINSLRENYVTYVQALLQQQQLLKTENTPLYQSLKLHLENILLCNIPVKAREMVEMFIFSIEPMIVNVKHCPHQDLEDISATHIQTSSLLIEKAILAGLYPYKSTHLHKLNLYIWTNFKNSDELTPAEKGMLLKELVDELCKMNSQARFHFALRIVRNNQFELALTNEMDIFNCYTTLLNAAKKLIPNYDLFYKLLGECSFLVTEMRSCNFQLTSRICNFAILSIHQICIANISKDNPHILSQATLMKTISTFLYESHTLGMFCSMEGDKGFLLLIDRLLPTLLKYDCLMDSIEASSNIPYALLLKPNGYPNKIDPWEDPARLELLRTWVIHYNAISGLSSQFNEEDAMRNTIAAVRLRQETKNGIDRESILKLKAMLENIFVNLNTSQITEEDPLTDDETENNSGSEPEIE